MIFSFLRGYFFRFLLVFVLGILVFEFYVFLVMSRDKRMAAEKKYVRDYEAALCSFTFQRGKVENPAGPCPFQGIVTTFKQPGLSRSMWLYANVIASSLATSLDAYVPQCLIDTLSQAFTNISTPPLSQIGHCSIALPESVATVADWTNPSQSIVITGIDLYNQQHVVKYIDVIAKHFEFSEALSELAHIVLHRAKGTRKNATYIGVHITNTKIIVNQEYDDVYPSVQFFQQAMDLFRKDFPDALFIVIADVETFWRSLFDSADVYIIPENSLSFHTHPLAILSHCNHTILASDGVAVWAAIFTGGRAVVSLSLADDYIVFTQRFTQWLFLLNATESDNKNFQKTF